VDPPPHDQFSAGVRSWPALRRSCAASHLPLYHPLHAPRPSQSPLEEAMVSSVGQIFFSGLMDLRRHPGLSLTWTPSERCGVRRGGGKRSGWFQTSLKSSKVRLAVLKRRRRVQAKRRKIVTLSWTPAGTLRRRVMERKQME